MGAGFLPVVPVARKGDVLLQFPRLVAAYPAREVEGHPLFAHGKELGVAVVARHVKVGDFAKPGAVVGHGESRGAVHGYVPGALAVGHPVASLPVLKVGEAVVIAVAHDGGLAQNPGHLVLLGGRAPQIPRRPPVLLFRPGDWRAVEAAVRPGGLRARLSRTPCGRGILNRGLRCRAESRRRENACAPRRKWLPFARGKIKWMHGGFPFSAPCCRHPRGPRTLRNPGNLFEEFA